MEAEQRAEQRAEEDTKIRMSKIPAKLVWHRTVGYLGRTRVLRYHGRTQALWAPVPYVLHMGGKIYLTLIGRL